MKKGSTNMYICKDCKAVFDEAQSVIEAHGFDDGLYETMYVCPECGSSNFSEAAACDKCGDLCAVDLMVEDKVNHTMICPNCADDTAEELMAEELADSYVKNEAKRMHYYKEQDMRSVVEYPQADSAYNMLKCGCWPVIKNILTEICADESKELWYAVAQHDPTSKSIAEQLWDGWIAQCVLSTCVCPGQLREMLGNMLLRYVWTHQLQNDQKRIISLVAYQLCPKLRLPHVRQYKDATDYSNFEALANDLVGTTRMLNEHDADKLGMTCVQVNDRAFNMRTVDFLDLIDRDFYGSLEKLDEYTEGEADEKKAAFMTDDEAIADRKQFVINLGKLLSQTRETVKEAYLDKEDQVHLYFKSGYEKVINVRHDSYLAIIKDVVKNIKL